MNSLLYTTLAGMAAAGSLLAVTTPAQATQTVTTTTESAQTATAERFPSVRPQVRKSASCGGMWVRVNHNRGVLVRPGGLFPSKSTSQRYWVRPNSGCWAHIEGRVNPHECGGQYRELNTVLERSVFVWQVSRTHKGSPC